MGTVSGLLFGSFHCEPMSTWSAVASDQQAFLCENFAAVQELLSIGKVPMNAPLIPIVGSCYESQFSSRFLAQHPNPSSHPSGRSHDHRYLIFLPPTPTPNRLGYSLSLTLPTSPMNWLFSLTERVILFPPSP